MPDDDWDDAADVDDEDWSDDESADIEDDSEDGEPGHCPECGKPVHAVTDKCPACGYWLTEADRRAIDSVTAGPSWIKLTAGFLLAALVAFVVLMVITAF